MAIPFTIPNPGYHNRFGFPYNTTLSFVPLIEDLEKKAADPGNLESDFYKSVVETIRAIPELLEPVEDLAIIKKYRKEVNFLMSTLLPSTVLDEMIAGVIVPFQPITIFGSPKFNQIMRCGEYGIWDLSSVDASKGISELIAFCGVAILKKYYNFSMTHPEMLKNWEVNKSTGMYTYYQPEINAMFAEVITKKQPRPLNEIDLTPLNENFFDAEFWMKNFPPDTFEFQGLTVYRMVDITDRELISQLEYTLLETGSILSKDNIKNIEEKFRSYFRIPKLRAGIGPMMSYQGEMVSCGSENWHWIIPPEKSSIIFKDFERSVYQKAIDSGNPYLVEDLQLLPFKTSIEEELLNQGIRNMVIIPLFQDQQIIGAIELGAPEPNQLNFISLLKLKVIMPLISIAFQRAAKEFDTKVQSTIKEQFTSIHPAVEWKFAKAALELISQNNSEGEKRVPVIELKDVTPIYGQVDIRGSSETRNEAIREDLIEYLTSAKNILVDAFKQFPLSILDEMTFQVDRYVDKLQKSMDSGDETSILEFMKQEVEPTFRVMSDRSPALKHAVNNYFSSLDAEHEIFHFRRGHFEQSLTMINDCVARILDEEESRTQLLLPHYFEKYKTDGVEYNLYLGQSILESGKFDPMFVKSFRLWQLITMVRIAREVHQLLPDLATPLETTQLILCYSNPFSIMFRMDEKRFDVAGAYNIRYEIVKKRIDKAHIKDTTERLTQPHKIAIIYTQDKEAREYERYFEFMRSKEWITGEIERHDVEPLQGLQGLKALRIQVKYDADEPKLNYDEEELFRQVKDVMV